MSIWGKILGGATGFALGGPIGALVGAVAGHAVDSIRADEASLAQTNNAQADGTQSIAFTIGVIALCAKMAKADGVVKRSEVEIFKRLFRVPPHELDNVGRVFDLARRDTIGFESYAQQIARLFQDRRAVLEELLDGLFAISVADGHLHEAELDYLRRVAHIFGFDDAEFERIRLSHDPHGVETGPYAVLGVAADASDDAVRQSYRRLVREHHPDKLIAQGLPKEFIDIATEKMATINAAYDMICRQRGIG